MKLSRCLVNLLCGGVRCWNVSNVFTCTVSAICAGAVFQTCQTALYLVLCLLSHRNHQVM